MRRTYDFGGSQVTAKQVETALDDFKAFVADALAEGMHEQLGTNDPVVFLKACMETWEETAGLSLPIS